MASKFFVKCACTMGVLSMFNIYGVWSLVEIQEKRKISPEMARILKDMKDKGV